MMNLDISNFYITILICTGIFVGFATGLLGVGGGFILVPVQFWILESIGINSTIAIRVAFGTSLAVILPTAISSAYGHYCRKCVLIKPAIILGVSGFLGGFIGGSIASNVNGDFLRVLFGIMLIGVSIQMILFRNKSHKIEKIENNYYYIFWGFIAGILSGLLGIGGGVIMIPIMVLIMGFTMLEAVGTSTAVIIFTSIGGIASYIYNGWGVEGLPPYSVGYINIIQMLVLILFTVLMAQIGLRVAHRLPEKYMKAIFVTVLIYMALKMIGIL
ncbi:MAG: sulfite exporter TauE/SafE family protein [Methanobacteriaceae archaeon]|nr:sulfite exporter TauE/SafE family protein [Methanobacteriaceae archaeon]